MDPVQQFGVCRLNLVSVRSAPEDRADQVTQLLFGDDYEVIEEKSKWVKIRNQFDQYEGWISRKQHHEISMEYFQYLNQAEFKITTDLTSSILYNKHPVTILMGSVIPISTSELFKMEEQFAFNGEAKSLGQKRDFDFMKVIANRYMRAPYQWGGKSPFGIDCSGFIQMVFKICGFALARDTTQQSKQGKPVKSFDLSQPGDLLFFKADSSKISHVGIKWDHERIIHASGEVRIDYVNEEGILHTEQKIYTHQLVSIRRVLINS